MIISFQLTMPNNNAWNGNWTGEGQPYFIIRSFKKKDIGFLNGKTRESFYYDFEDGWGANVTAEIVTAKEGKIRRRASKGFGTYQWMVKEIIEYGKIIPRQERIEARKQKLLIEAAPDMLKALISIKNGLDYMEQTDEGEHILNDEYVQLILKTIDKATK